MARAKKSTGEVFLIRQELIKLLKAYYSLNKEENERKVRGKIFMACMAERTKTERMDRMDRSWIIRELLKYEK